MIRKRTIRLILLLGIVAMNVGCDQISKNLIRNKVGFDENISIIKDHFILTKVENTGAFLSAGDTLPGAVRLILFSLLPILVLSYGLFYLISKANLPRLMQVGLCFLIGGGIGNVYDRLRHGSVTDFMHIDFGLFRTGVFNFADVSILMGVGMLLLVSFKKRELPSWNKTEDPR